MFGIDRYAAFISAILLFQLVPGPGTFTILHATARGGIAAGLCAVVGTLAGDLVYMIAAATGLAALLTASPLFFNAMQWAGIAYLCRCGWQLLRAANGDAGTGDVALKCGWRSFRQALGVGLTNPKVILFFLAFFPLFMNVDTRPVTLGVMVAHVSLICIVYQTCLVLAGDRVARWLARVPGARVIASRLAGMALIGFGVRLAFGSR
jgi:threonine/homoserine/homoserine lactone efflux protein